MLQMLHWDSKFFVPFPEFFREKQDDAEVYLGINFTYRDIYTSVNIIFTRSENLEEIKNALQKEWKNWEEPKNMTLPVFVKLAIQKAYEKLNEEQPVKPEFKLEFKEGEKSYCFSEKSGILTVFIKNEKLPIPERAFFYPACT